MVAAELSLDLFADFDNSLKKLHKKIDSNRAIRRTIFGSGLTVASGFGDYAIVECTERPSQGKIWNLRAVTLLAGQTGQANNPITQNPAGSYQLNVVPTVFSTTAAAAAAASLTITTAYLRGFRVDPAAAWPAGVNQVTVTQLNGGTQTYDLPGGTTNSLIVSYGAPVPAPFGNPVISVPAIATGPAYSLNAEGLALGNGAINTWVDLYAGQTSVSTVPFQGASQPDLGSLLLSNQGPLPVNETFTKGCYWIQPGELLYGVFSAVPGANTECVIIARVDEYSLYDVLTPEI